MLKTKTIKVEVERTVNQSIVEYWDQWVETWGTALLKMKANLGSPSWFLGETYISSEGKKALGSHIGNTYADPRKCAHWLVVGETGMGKTDFLRSLVIHRLYQDPETNIEFFEGKGTTEDFKLISQYTSPHGATDKRDSLETIIERFYQEHKRRVDLFKSQSAVDMEDYNKLVAPTGESLKDWVLVIDRVDLAIPEMIKDNDVRKPIAGSTLEKLLYILRGARSYGIQVVMTTNSPRDKFVPNIIKELTNKVIFSLDLDDASYLGKVESAAFLKRGEYLLDFGFDKAVLRAIHKNHYVGRENMEKVIQLLGLKKKSPA